MFYSLLLATFIVAALVSLLVVKLFDKPIGLILERIIQDKISSAWRRYITFAAFVAGISGGVRIYALERYIEPTKENVAPLVLNGERWTLEIYRTIIECLQSIAWTYLVVFAFALVAYVVVKNAEIRHRRAESKSMVQD